MGLTGKSKLLILLALFSQGCSSFLYYPSGKLFYPPEKVGQHPDDMWFKSLDGTKLNGWYFHNKAEKPPKAVFVFFHGNAENMSSHYLNLLWVLDKQYDFLIFDYRGYGRSAEEPDPEGTVKDGIAALKWVQDKNPGVPLIVFGQSLGGAISLRAYEDSKADLPQVKLVIADSTFSSYKMAARSILRKHWFSWILQPLTYITLSDKYAPEDKLSDISPTPLLVIHGTDDQSIDYELGQRIFSLAKDPKEFWTVPGGHHTDAFWAHGDVFKKKLLEKLKTLGM